MIKYQLSFPNRLTHFIEITMEVGQIDNDKFELILPDWRPGRYELTNYVSNVKNFKVESGGQSIGFKKTARNKWLIDTDGISILHVKYQYYAYKMDAGSSVVDEEMIYINFINCLMYNEDKVGDEIEISIEPPENDPVTCSLTPNEKGVFYARDFYEVVDSPFLSARELRELRYNSRDYNFTLQILGDCPLTDDLLISEFKQFSDYQIKMMNGFPTEKFDFIIHSLPYKHYHGVEHKNSTVLVLGPNTNENKKNYHLDLLGVASHELFHVWNVTRIHPIEFSPYDFSKEGYYETGFVTEGFTTYYGDLMLVRSGVFDENQYLKELNILLKRHFENYGRHHLSLVDSSFDLWIDGYKKLLPGRKVSIYVKGAIIALLLDLTIRLSHKNTLSLDDLIRDLWSGYGKVEKGYRKEDVYGLIEKYIGQKADSLIEKFYEGIIPVEDTLGETLGSFGFDLVKINHPERSADYYGFRVDKRNDNYVVNEIAPNSTAESCLSIGDQIISIDGEPVSDTRFGQIPIECTLLIKRNHKEKVIRLKVGAERYYSIYEIRKTKNPDNFQIANFNSWLFDN